MTRLRHKLFGSLIICVLIGFVFLTPANASAPSWVGVDKYAKYHGGIDIAPLPEGDPNYLRIRAVVDFNWTITDVTSTARIAGGWNISFLIVFNNTPFFQGYFGVSGYEEIGLSDSVITAGGGYDLFGLETVGQPTNIWVEDVGALTPANFSLGGRQVGFNTAMLTLPIPDMTDPIPVTKYYEHDTGALIALNLGLNITALGGGLIGLGDLGVINLPVEVSNTNVFPYAWNPGGDITLWLMALGLESVAALISAGFVYIKKK